MFQSRSVRFLPFVCFIAATLLASKAFCTDPPCEAPNVKLRVTGRCGSTNVAADGCGATPNEACLDGQKKIRANNPTCQRLILDICPPALMASPDCKSVPYTIIYWCCEANGQWTGFTVSAPTLQAAICAGKANAHALGLTCCCTRVEILSGPCPPKKKRQCRLFR